MKIKNSAHRGEPLYIFQIFSNVSSFNFLLNIKLNTVFGLSKYSCIRIDKHILGINNLFFYENEKFRPQGGPFVYISDCMYQLFSRLSKLNFIYYIIVNKRSKLIINTFLAFHFVFCLVSPKVLVQLITKRPWRTVW